MNEVAIAASDPREAGARALLEASHALMESLFPSESNHYLSVEALAASEITFFTARRGDETLGCGALARMQGYGEVKSMFVAPEARRTGAGAKILAAIEGAARAADLPLLRLETGKSLHAAHALYERAGFVFRGPFGDYPDDPFSVFMEKRL